jgi:hypothetical protein
MVEVEPEACNCAALREAREELEDRMNIALVARNTFRESTRDRILAGVGIAGLVLILLTLPKAARVTLRVFDVAGREVGDPVSRELPAGEQELYWRAPEDRTGEVGDQGAHARGPALRWTQRTQRQETQDCCH